MKEKILNIIVIVIAILLITGGCIFAYMKFASEPIEVVKETISKDPIFTLENYPKVDASLATQPLTDAFIKGFTGTEDVESRLDYTNTHPGYIRLVDGEVDLIVVTEPSSDELKYAQDHNVELDVTPVVREGFVFYVNSENTVDSLTVAQIQDIYSGKITNWKEVGGIDAPIKAFQRPANSGSQTGMLSLVMRNIALMEPPKENIIETMFDIVNVVSNFDTGINSIGYSYYYYANTMFETMNKEIKDGIKFVKVNGVEPNNKTIKEMNYPFETAYYIVTRKGDVSSETQKLKDAMLSDWGQQIAEEVGYVGVK